MTNPEVRAAAGSKSLRDSGRASFFPPQLRKRQKDALLAGCAQSCPVVIQRHRVLSLLPSFQNYMIKAGGVFVDIKDPACLEENSRELKVLIRRKHLPSVHR